MSNIINCCFGCVPPERHPGCHSTCKRYKDQRAVYDERKAIDDERRRVRNSCYIQRDEAVRKTMKGKR